MNEIKIEEKTCIRCGVKKDKLFMYEFDGVFTCQLTLFCEERCLLISKIKENKNLEK